MKKAPKQKCFGAFSCYLANLGQYRVHRLYRGRFNYAVVSTPPVVVSCNKAACWDCSSALVLEI